MNYYEPNCPNCKGTGLSGHCLHNGKHREGLIPPICCNCSGQGDAEYIDRLRKELEEDNQK